MANNLSPDEIKRRKRVLTLARAERDLLKIRASLRNAGYVESDDAYDKLLHPLFAVRSDLANYRSNG